MVRVSRTFHFPWYIRESMFFHREHPKKRQSSNAINKKEYLFELRSTAVIRFGPWWTAREPVYYLNMKSKRIYSLTTVGFINPIHCAVTAPQSAYSWRVTNNSYTFLIYIFHKRLYWVHYSSENY